ncbi:nuclear transport factor 2 family protein [Streptomyces sp. WI04-05B]|uniref:nuclear transport factor 2 family protein n=1 Tax=Streptomyces TaxID=1883 RepID=UPI0029A02A7C|nr:MULTISPECIES: nuclear transport factor 2 family protein [unclassified Streptomyces]MDX2546811.1 nuclear transport factor 2 family protein [Streptomyces sp. WI04-05B]MDX2589607.1 nuclear transport factor 2 family protein [Streptomyces sp. WI04-05A]
MTTTVAETAATDIPALEVFCDRWEKAWNDHDGDAVAALCADDLVYDEPALGETAHGPDSIREFVTQMAHAFPDYSFTRMGLYGEVTRRAVLVAWRFSGTLAGTDQRVEFHGDDRLELGEDGLIHAYRCLYDYRFVLSQLKRAGTSQ